MFFATHCDPGDTAMGSTALSVPRLFSLDQSDSLNVHTVRLRLLTHRGEQVLSTRSFTPVTSPSRVSIFSTKLSCSVYHHTYHIISSLRRCQLLFHQHRVLIPRIATSYNGQVLNKKSNKPTFFGLLCCIARSASRYSTGATKTRTSDRR